MLIEGGYLHSLKTLLEKADDGSTTKPPSDERPPSRDDRGDDRRGLTASLRKWRERLLRRSVN